MKERYAAVVIGAGFAGLGTASALRRRGVEAVVLDRSDAVGNSWRNRYESLRLNTLRWMSTLHGYRMPRHYGRWPTRDQIVEYLEDFAREEDLLIEFGAEVKRIARANGGWTLETSAGDVGADAVVVGIGYDVEPKLPDWPGLDGFRGELIHASAYRNPKPYEGKDVLVVAPGNTGSEIAAELTRNGAGRVRAAMRSIPYVTKREWLGIPTPLIAYTIDPAPTWLADRSSALFQRVMLGNLRKFGFGPATYGLATTVRDRHVAPVIDAGFIDSLKAGEIELVAAVAGFDGSDVILADGDRIQPESVIAATGYHRGLEPLVGHLGVLDERGEPTHRGPHSHPQAPGLFFVGYDVWLRGQLPKTSRDARRVAKAISRELKRS